MKKRNLFLILGLALTLGTGVAGGLSLNRGEAKKVRLLQQMEEFQLI
jgi:hypothetical protein